MAKKYEQELALLEQVLDENRFSSFLNKAFKHLNTALDQMDDTTKAMSRVSTTKVALESLGLMDELRDRAIAREEAIQRLRLITAESDLKERSRDSSVDLSDILKQIRAAKANSSKDE